MQSPADGDHVALYESLVENLPLYVLRKDLQGRIVFANERFCELLQIPRDELIGRTDHDLFPQHLADKYREDDRHVIATGEVLHAEEEHQTQDGKVRYVEIYKAPVRNGLGNNNGVQVVFWDVTGRKTTESELRYERYLLHALLNNIPDSIYFKDDRSRFVRVSKSLAEKFGLRHPSEAIGKTDAEFFTSEHAELARRDEEELMRTGVPVLGKIEKETWADGHRTWCSTTKLPLRNDEKQVIGTFGISRDITNLIEIEQALARERDLLRTLMDQLPDLIYVKDAAGHFVTVNLAAQRMLGASSLNEVQGKTNYDFLPAEIAERYDEDDHYVLETGKPLIDREERLIDREGRERWWLTTKVPLKDKQGRVTGLVGIDRDTTKRKQAVEALRRAKEAADAANRAKSDFLANMSHEIRTPMNAIVGMTELLLDTRVERNQREYLEMIRESGDALMTIINDILDFSKIEADKLELEETEFDPRVLLEDTMRSLSLRAHAKGIETAVQLDHRIPAFLCGDPGRLRQIVINLVGNAIKFTDAGEVVLLVALAGHAEDHVRLKFVVRDTGIGIPEEKQQKIFRAFEQADSSTTRSYGGTGLGLAISARLVQAMGGQIKVSSHPEQGSEFEFVLRLKTAEGGQPPPPLSSADLVDAPVLIVDDHATNRRILTDMLGNWGMKPAAVESAEQALDVLREARQQGEPFQLVLSDVNMPEVDGFTMVRRIRDDQELAATPVIMLTSGMRKADSGASKQLKVSTHLLKPVKQSELFDAIVSALGPADDQAAGAGRTAETDAPAMAKLKILLAEDNVVNQRLAIGVLSKYGHTVDVVENGRDAVTRSAANDYDMVLMDVQMPLMDGFDATRAIRAREQGSETHLPIVAMTAHAMKGDRQRCLDAGMDDYIAKPIRMNLLAEILMALFPDSGGSAPDDSPSRTRGEAIDWDLARQTVQQDEDLLRIVAETYLEDEPRLIESIASAIAAGDADTARLSAHSLKGALKSIAAIEASGLARRVEEHAGEGQLDEAAADFAELQVALDAVGQALRGLLEG